MLRYFILFTAYDDDTLRYFDIIRRRLLLAAISRFAHIERDMLHLHLFHYAHGTREKITMKAATRLEWPRTFQAIDVFTFLLDYALQDAHGKHLLRGCLYAALE